MSGVTPARWLGQTKQLFANLDQINDLGQRGKTITELIDNLWNDVLPALGKQRREVVRRLYHAGLSDAKIAEQIGVNRQRVAQLRKE